MTKVARSLRVVSDESSTYPHCLSKSPIPHIISIIDQAGMMQEAGVQCIKAVRQLLQGLPHKGSCHLLLCGCCIEYLVELLQGPECNRRAGIFVDPESRK